MRRILLTLVIILVLSACERQEQSGAEDNAVVINAWFHSGREGERRVIINQVEQFNSIQHAIHVKLTILPEGSYNSQVQAAALAGDLPDILEFDGPYLYNYIWQGHLIPLDKYVSRNLRADLLPTILEQGTFEGHLYSIGTFDSGLGLYASRSDLEKAMLRIPNGPGDAWSVEEFDKVLASLAKNDPDGAVLDLKVNYRGEWYTYAFSPIIQSAGADLIDRKDYQASSGFLNSPSAIYAFQQVQSWFKHGYVEANVDDSAFILGRTALSWVGHWEYPRYVESLGDNLVVLPLPDFGYGARSGQGSWNWGITKNSRHPEQAYQFLEFILQPDQVLAMASANGAVPARRSVVIRSPLYKAGGPLELFSNQLLSGFTVPRPRTPGYPVISSVFQKAFDNIRNGSDVKDSLDKAALEIDQDIKDNNGYLMID